MAPHSMALDPPLRTAYHMNYSDPDCGILEPFMLERNVKADESSIVGKWRKHLMILLRV